MSVPRRIATGVLAAVAVAVLVIVRSSGQDHEVRATFSSAVNVVPGAEVRAGGVSVGKVASIEVHGHAARLTLRIDDDRLWPLREGTRARIRLGGTVSYANRYIELVPTPGSGRALAAGGEIPAQDTTSPFEFDQLFNLFDKPTRAGTGALVDRGAATFAKRGPALRQALADGGPGLTESGLTFGELARDPHALRTLVSAGDQVAGELARRDQELRDLVDGAAQTLTTVASSGGDVRRTIRALPGTLRAARATLGRVDGSLDAVDGLVGDVAPGARELRRIASPLRGVVGTLRAVSPQLEATLARLQRSGPTISRFLQDAVPQVQRLRPTLSRLAPMTACVRAYSPEIAGFFSTWSSLSTGLDASGRYAWLNGQVYPFPDVTPTPSVTIARAFPQLRYALVRPPGLNADDPWLQPSCGSTAAGLDPTKDPEARR